MRLIYKNYTAEPEEGTVGRWTLSHTVEITGKDKKKKQVKKLIGYSYTFESMLKKIAVLESQKGTQDLTIAEYIANFKGILEEITNKLKV